MGLGVGEAVAPEVRERAEVATVRSFESGGADGHFHGAPFSGPLGREIAADAGVELRQEIFIERSHRKFLGQHRRLQPSDAPGEQRR